MAKGATWTDQDLAAKGIISDSSGGYRVDGNRISAASIIPLFTEHVKKIQMPPVSLIQRRPAEKKDVPKIPKPRPIGIIAIENVLKASGVEYVTEHIFSTKKGYRFDFAVPSMMLGIEYEGIFSNTNGQNGHTGVKHYVKDCKKYNLAQIEGWKVLRYTAKNYKHFIDDLNQLLTK